MPPPHEILSDSDESSSHEEWSPSDDECWGCGCESSDECECDW